MVGIVNGICINPGVSRNHPQRMAKDKKSPGAGCLTCLDTLSLAVKEAIKGQLDLGPQLPRLCSMCFEHPAFGCKYAIIPMAPSLSPFSFSALQLSTRLSGANISLPRADDDYVELERPKASCQPCASAFRLRCLDKNTK